MLYILYTYYKHYIIIYILCIICYTGLPIVLSCFLPGQEAGNVPYVVEGGFGLYNGMMRVLCVLCMLYIGTV